jgi:hypothetical protein
MKGKRGAMWPFVSYVRGSSSRAVSSSSRAVLQLPKMSAIETTSLGELMLVTHVQAD